MTKSNASYKKGDVVDAPFPYQSDSEEEKYRPVLVLAPTPTGGLVCAYITTKSHRDGVIPILAKDFKEGMLGYDASTNELSMTWGEMIADKLVGDVTEYLVGATAEGGTLALVGLFGHAGTGTAISGLSGIAAKSAALAWLGGGSLATGGGGMALGSLVLGGITLAPILLVSGFMMGAKGDKALTRAIEYQEEVNIEIDRIIEAENFLLKVNERICNLYNLVNELDDTAIDILNQLESKSFDRNRDAVKFQRLTFLLKAVVEIMKAPVLSSNGKLNPDTKILVVKYSNFQG